MSNHHELLASQRVLSMLESACEHSEETLDRIPSALLVLAQDNRVIRANPSAARLMGCTPDEALHRDFTRFFTTENRTVLMHHLEKLRAADASSDPVGNFRVEVGGHHPDAPAKPYMWRGFRPSHTSGAEGTVVSLIGDDLSGLYQSELKLSSIFASLPLGLMVMDCNGRILEVLSDHCHVLLHREQLVGESLGTMLVESNPDQANQIRSVFHALRSAAGHPVQNAPLPDAQHATLQHLMGSRLATDSDDALRWVRPRFQAIGRNGVIDRYMVTLEDVTESWFAQQRIEQADILGRQAQALYECAIRDPLSGLYTRLFMQDSISKLIAAARRGSLDELAVVIFDLDNFKSVNDTHGHDAGDQVIREFGRIVLACIRETDVAVRYGGEEFIVALPSGSSQTQGGEVVAERIRETLASTPITLPDGKRLSVSTSCGVAYCRRDDTLPALIQRADKLLYAAKQAGKNRVCSEPKEGA